MRDATPALIALLNSTTNFLMADLYTVTLIDGTILRWTTLDMPLTWGGHVFTPAGTAGAPLVSRNSTSIGLGLTVDTLDLILSCGDSVTLFNVPMPLAAGNGAFDGGTITLERAFMPTWGDLTAGTIELFVGDVGDVSPTSTSVTLQVLNILDRLNIQMPRYQFLPGCGNRLYDAACTLSKASFTSTGAFASGVTDTIFTAASSTGKAAGYFEKGVLTVTSGLAAGAHRAVRSFDGTTFVLVTPLPVVPSPGDTFSVFAGCPRQYDICGSRFSNQANFIGFKDIPIAETAI